MLSSGFVPVPPRYLTAVYRRGRLLAAALAVLMALTACTTLTRGRGSSGLLRQAPDAHLNVVNTNGSRFDQTAQNAIADVVAYWKKEFPQIAGGASLPPLRGKLYSVDGGKVAVGGRLSAAVLQNGCLKQDPTSIVDNAFYCQDDDSIAWDRDPQHLVPALGDHYGPLLTVAVFAHEFGHAIQARLKIFDQNPPTIYTESQADCAAGAFLGAVIKGQSAHFQATIGQLDTVLLGYLNVRDPPPVSTSEIDHGDGFDRLTAMADGIQQGATYCFRSDYFTRKFTERPYTSDQDYEAGGNEPLADLLNPDKGGLVPDLNRYFDAAAKRLGKSWSAVRIAQAAKPPCSDKQFAYCASDNTVYYTDAFAKAAYYSLPTIEITKPLANVKVITNAPADYALGTLFAYAWGMAARHAWYGKSTDDQAALLAASCYAGSYSANINHEGSQGEFVLSPPDMDEATAAVIKLVPQDAAFGARGTNALQRIQYFDKGYFDGLSSC